MPIPAKAIFDARQAVIDAASRQRKAGFRWADASGSISMSDAHGEYVIATGETQDAVFALEQLQSNGETIPKKWETKMRSEEDLDAIYSECWIDLRQLAQGYKRFTIKMEQLHGTDPMCEQIRTNIERVLDNCTTKMGKK